jgi:Cys-rich repeat protein
MRALLGITLALSVAALGCESRFPVCKTDDDCKAKASADPSAKSLLCYDLRCVQCRNDSDCGDGQVCARNKGECESIGGPVPKYGEPVPDPTTELPPEPSASAAPATSPAKK